MALKQKQKKNKYKCKYCNMAIKRDSDKQWIASYCHLTGKNVRLMKVKE